jgi:hypothetical protein
MPGGRELTVACIGTIPVVATVLRYGCDGAVREPMLARWARRGFVGLLATIHVTIAPLLTLGTAEAMRKAGRAGEQIADEMLAIAGGGRRLVVIAASDPLVWMHVPLVALDKEHPNRCWWTVAAARASYRLIRTGPSTLSLEVHGSTLLKGPFEQLFRPPEMKFAVGDAVQHCGARVEVAAIEDGFPVRLTVDFREPLEKDPGLVIAAWRDGRLERIAPTDLATPLVVPWSRGPMEFF